MKADSDPQAPLMTSRAGRGPEAARRRRARVGRGLVLVVAASLVLTACATAGPPPESSAGRPALLDQFVTYLKKAYEDLKGALTPAETRSSTPKGPAEEPQTVTPARQAVERGDYPGALSALDRVLAAQPQHGEAIELRKAALYRLGRAQVDEGRYADAYQTLIQLVRLAPGYEDSTTVLRAVRDRLVRQHYTEGVRLFADERVEDAIAQWRTALEYDPQHVNARRNLERAERILKGLEQRRAEQRGAVPEALRLRVQPVRGGDGT